MSEWWTYSLSDFLLFSSQTYYRLFELYNRDLWPLQIVCLLLGITILGLLHRGGIRRERLATAILAAIWLWVAFAFIFQRYATINWAAPYFGVGFGLEAFLLSSAGVTRHRIGMGTATGGTRGIGLGIFLFALVGYPFTAPLFGRPWAQAEVFGLTPDPTVMATLGIVLSSPQRFPWLLLAIPLIWCVISGATLWTMDSPEALVLPLTALLVVSLVAWRTDVRRQQTKP